MTSNLKDKLLNCILDKLNILKNRKAHYRYLQLQHAISEVSVVISRGEDKYHSRLAQKLSDPSPNSKIFWSILKWFCNGNKLQLFYPYWSIVSWNWTSKLRQIILISLLLIRHSMFQPSDFPHFFLTRKLY